MCNHDPKVKVKSKKAGFEMGPIDFSLVYSLFAVTPIVCWGLLIGLCLCVHLLSCQLRVTVTSCFVYKVIRYL